MNRIGIIDADLLDNGTRHPNLALMKISGFLKNSGHEVRLLESYDDMSFFDEVYVSKVFTYTRTPEWLPQVSNVKIGGTGFFPEGDDFLPYEIEHHMPDYSLYDNYLGSRIKNSADRQKYSDYLDYSIGFATRGCFRKCDFCVNKKYDHVFKHSPISEFIDYSRPYIYLWDDNFLGFSGWEQILDQLEDSKKPFQFRQGLDVRLMTDKIAQRLSQTRYHGDFIFAFDHIKDRDLIESKLKLWRRYSSKTTKLYVLCAFDSQDENDIISAFERIRILMKHGCLPYIMRYESYKMSRYRSVYTQLARWCNQPKFFKKKSFRQFCVANQDYHRNASTNCVPYQALIDFEREHPDIAKEYFDLRYDEINEYSTSYGYERKYANKPDCETCSSQSLPWSSVVLPNIDIDAILSKYFTKEIDLQCLTYSMSLCGIQNINSCASWLCDTLKETPIEYLLNIIKHSGTREEITSANIPQYSNLADSLHSVVEILSKTGGAKLSFNDLGYYLDGKSKSNVARRKYGENHAKFSSLLDLALITSYGNVNYVEMSVLGRAYISYDTSTREIIASRLMLRIPIIQSLMINAQNQRVVIEDLLVGLSEPTMKRRRSKITELVSFIKRFSSADSTNLFNNLIERKYAVL